jgi:hypothetical protein
MKCAPAKKLGRKQREAGQAMILLILVLGLVLLGAAAFSVDMGNLWFHRQAAQNTADAACTAAVMDMLWLDNGSTGFGGFTPGTPFSCSSSITAAPCVYAAKNMGYDASTLAAGTPGYDVSFKFPSSVPGVPTCSSGKGAPPICDASSFAGNPYVQVNVDDRTQLYFAGLLSGSKTADIGAQATCGVVFSNAPIPLLILDPRSESSVTNNGAYSIQIVGGPQRSIQVNASSTNAVNVNGGSGTIDLTKGGPQNTGSDFGVTGSESQVTGFTTGSTGNWLDPTGAISDPFANLAVPSQPGSNGTVTYGVTGDASWGCPDIINGCDHYTGGYYPSGIHVEKGKNADGSNNTAATGLAVFDPGLYYLGGNLSANSNSCLRPSTATGDGSGGTLFYFSGTATARVGSNSGTLTQGPGSARTFDCQDLNTSTTPPTIQNSAWAVSLDHVRCITAGTGKTILPDNVVSFGGLVGNVLLGPCQAPTAGGTNYGDPLGTDDPLGEQRGMLFFQNRLGNLASAGNQPLWSGGGAFGLAGNIYFHYCPAGTGPGGCDSTTGFTDQLELGGGSSSSTFVVGDIVTDKLFLHGNPQIEMDLNPNALYYVLKATLLQ